MRLIAPAYGYPAGSRPLWDGLVAAGDAIGHVIINPGSGPGDDRDPVWNEQISRLDDRGIPMLGYLNLAYSGKPAEDLMVEAERWRRWYGIVDFFLDCAPSSDVRRTGHVADILRSGARARELVANAGTRTAPDVARHFDAIVEHEGVPPFTRPPRGGPGHRVPRVPSPDRAWIVHSADPHAARVTMDAAAAMGISEIWVTDLAGANPYRDLPTYWEWLVEALAGLPEA